MNKKMLIEKRRILRNRLTVICNSVEKFILNFKEFKEFLITKDILLEFYDQLVALDEKIFYFLDAKDLDDELADVYKYNDGVKRLIHSFSCYVQKPQCEESKSLTGADKTSCSSSCKREKCAKCSILKWQEFWNGFVSLINNGHSLIPVIKFVNYPDNDLEDIVHLNNTETIALLHKILGTEQSVKYSDLSSSFESSSTTAEIEKLKLIYYQCEELSHCLKAFGESTFDKIFSPELKASIHCSKSQDKWELNKLKQNLKQEIQIRERTECEFEEISKQRSAKVNMQNPDLKSSHDLCSYFGSYVTGLS